MACVNDALSRTYLKIDFSGILMLASGDDQKRAEVPSRIFSSENHYLMLFPMLSFSLDRGTMRPSVNFEIGSSEIGSNHIVILSLLRS